jgi:hypothetical protein
METKAKEQNNYSWQICQDIETNDDFRKLHHDIVNQIIKFCRNHDIEIDDFCISADGVRGSIPYEHWQACTDSSFAMYAFDEEHPNMKSEPKPYLLSI